MSSTPANKDHYYTGSLGKSRRSSPGDSQGIPFFQTGQGGRTILPPFSAAFPNLPFPGPSYSNAYTAPRSSPGRYDLTAQALYPTQWPPGNSPPLAPAFPNYDMTTAPGRYSPQPSYGYSSRSSPPLPPSAADPRKLPPLATPSSPGDRWQQTTAYGVGSGMHGYASTTHANNIRSPAASYAQPYVTYQGGNQNSAYTYITHEQLSMNTQAHPSLFDDHLDNMRLQPRPTSPYGRSGHPSQMSASNYATPPPISPTSPEEPTIKKKRKRADAAQLKVLNETYARTAFPSTEERHALAKALDMSARSVQIWFQNKRQSMRQTNRQSNTTVSSSHQPYGVTSSHSERMMEESMSPHSHGHPSNFPGGQMPAVETAFMTQPTVHDLPRSHTSHSSSSHRRYRSPEEVDSHKWSQRGY